MKFTLSWLKEHLETDASLREITDTLTMIGLELEGVEDRSSQYADFVVAHVVAAEQHPNADRLQVCQVDTGSGTYEVVCGAPNARAGMKGVFAPEGSYIPGIDTKLKKSKIRGVVSNGMLLSEKEMGLSEDHAGIVELADDAEIGTPAADAMGLGDPVIDIGITPNRGDCLGVYGIARDLAAAGLGKLKPYDKTPVAGGFKSPIGVHLDFDDDTANACPLFVGRYLRGVKNGPSPQWLQDKLTAIGLRPISALVDVTNYMTIAYGRPLHVFDADKVSGDIHVRLSRPGEKLLALDGKTYELDGEMTVICGGDTPEGLGGVMGGEETGCTETTTNVFIESAYFDPVRTAATGRKLNLQSDARYRFERGIDPVFTADGMEVATRLFQELVGGEASEPVIAGRTPAWERFYFLRHSRVEALGGVAVPGQEIERILTDLGFGVEATANPEGEDGWSCEVPSWRHDVVGEADLVEEVVRIHGYDNIPIVPLERESALPKPAVNGSQERRNLARRALAGRGITEAVTFSFLPSAEAALFGGGAEELNLVNPISADLDVMRPSLLPNLIAAAGRNADRGHKDLALFEIGPQYAGAAPGDQSFAAGGIRVGASGPRHWAAAPRHVDVFDAKADALAVLEAIGAPVASLQVFAEAPSWFHPGRSGTLRLGPQKVLAAFGEIHPGTLAQMDVAGPVAGFEIFLDELPPAKAGKGKARATLELSPYQAVERDFAFIVDDTVSADSVVRAAQGADKNLITEVSLFDLFAGPELGDGKKSLAISVVLQPTEATLTDAQIDAVSNKVVAAVTKATGGTLRG